jgi:CRISPR/Cas system-associated exonuclease Cas4 (RecB family)
MTKKSFLQYVAKDIVAKHGVDLNRVAVVFPNKRASLFLDQALYEEVKRPIWSPAYLTISDLFRAHSNLQVPEEMELVFQLYDVYCPLVNSSKTLDQFYGWGQLMLADFDDIDKNMADAEKLFLNVEAFQQLSTTDYLTDEQRECLEKFFGQMTWDSELQRNFNLLWSNLANIYNAYRQRLRDQGLAYEGMLYRDVAEDKGLDFHYDLYIFVGFNLLQQVEQTLFKRLLEEGRAEFYWDFDEAYLHRDAGNYIRTYMDKFPNELSHARISNGLDYDEIYQQMNLSKDITYLSSSTETIQASYIGNWLLYNHRIEDGARTAIVLADENLLQTVVHCLPKEVKDVNITTGYPLAAAPVSAWVEELIDLQLNGHQGLGNKYRLKYVQRVLHNPLAKYLSEDCRLLSNELRDHIQYYPSRKFLTDGYDEVMKVLFSSEDTDPSWSLLEWIGNLLQRVGVNMGREELANDTRVDPLIKETVFKMFTLINRLSRLVVVNMPTTAPSSIPQPASPSISGSVQGDGRRAISIEVMRRLMRQFIQSTTVPFHGEPVVGIQIMGVLETRNLDFDHVLLLSCNEGNLPKGVNDVSLIPHSIRKAYGLTTVENKVAIYSYYFHSLLQRASDVSIIYNNATDEGNKGEMSRFMLQLLVDRPEIHRAVLQAGKEIIAKRKLPKEKDEETMKKLESIDKLSPTAINRYLRCPMMFYFNSVVGLKEPDENEEDEIDNRTFGNIFHRSAELIYCILSKNFTKTVTPNDIDAFIKDPAQIDKCIMSAFKTDLFKLKDDDAMPRLNGLQLINKKVVKRYLNYLLEVDKRLGDINIVSLEKRYEEKISFPHLSSMKEIVVGGNVDRLDQIVVDGQPCLRIVDYKTGTPLTSIPTGVDELFDSTKVDDKHTVYYLQTFLYSFIVKKQIAKGGTTTSNGEGHLSLDGMPIRPALFFVRQASNEDYDPTLRFNVSPRQKTPISDITVYHDAFMDKLKGLLTEIFNPDVPFQLTVDTKRCTNCPYQQICG